MRPPMKLRPDGPIASLRSARLGFLALCALVLLVFVPTAGAASGDLAWSRTFNGTGDGPDAFTYAVPAPSGGVYIAGETTAANASSDLLVARYDAGGQRRWLHTYNGSSNTGDYAMGAAVDRDGNLVVVGVANDANWAVLKYGPGGQRRWVRIYDDPASPEEVAMGVAVDSVGNIYVAGYRSTATTGNDILLIKYSPSGARKWLRSYGRPGGSDDRPNDMATDAAGNVYVTGHSTGAGGFFDALTLKYDATGHRRWARNWEGPAGGYDSGDAIAVTGAGTVYVAGQTAGTTSGDDGFVLKYSTGGALKWNRFKTSAGAFSDRFSDIALLGGGDVAAAGTDYGGAGHQTDFLLVRLSPVGGTRWMRTYNGPDGQEDQGRLVAVGSSGDVYVVGYSYSNTTASDFLTLKYGAAGGLRWARRYSSPPGGSSDFPGTLIATAGGVYVAGQQQNGASSDAVVVRYRP